MALNPTYRYFLKNVRLFALDEEYKKTLHRAVFMLLASNGPKLREFLTSYDVAMAMNFDVTVTPISKNVLKV